MSLEIAKLMLQELMAPINVISWCWIQLQAYLCGMGLGFQGSKASTAQVALRIAV
jgi:hypothetical protein